MTTKLLGPKLIVKLNGDADAIKAQVKTLAGIVGVVIEPDEKLPNVEVSMAAVLDGTSLEELREYVQERFRREGIEVSFTAAEVKPEPKLDKKKKTGRPPLVDTETAARKLKEKGNGEDAQPNFEQTDEVDAEGARAQVITFLSKQFEIPAQRPRVTDFSTRMGKKFGKSGEKLSLLPTEAFPAILIAMEKEFGA